MSRPTQPRKIVAPPRFSHFGPNAEPAANSGTIDFLYEEYEAIKLCDYELMHQQEAANLMGISRQTFARIYESARRKVAKAFVEQQCLKVVYGNACLHGDWRQCNCCKANFTVPINMHDMDCALCGSVDTKPINRNTQANGGA